ncbi:alkaline phosphatase family protein [Burkholderiaceae bacterium FT117]|uniref:alkaline phosphatase family protein n=1 Tax=Zeimonas sediminis TaxID=2944268 RepID=UPI0023431CA0|nr:alkaline phosphatase family protein [Zeimonas sediminis]MCM5571523.1 alkaline phosphatase family protein [Zeimonas sediminis]
MSQPVIAIGLDAADPVLVERWMDGGHLPNLARIRNAGAYGRLKSTVEFRGEQMELFATEPLWVDFVTGCNPTSSGAWDSTSFSPATGRVRRIDEELPAFDAFEPFYALGEQRKVAVFDLPITRLSDRVNGIQVLGWGGHFPHTERHSVPRALLSELTERHGRNAIFHKDTGIWWDKEYLKWLDGALASSVRARTAICLDLMERDDWDLFLAVFAEPHTAGHDVYCFSQPDHPLYSALASERPAEDLLLRTYQDVDRAIGEIAAKAPSDAVLMCFSLHGMGPNYSDLLSSVVISELLYRFNFPGSAALGAAGSDSPPGPLITHPRRKSWIGELWTRYNGTSPIARFVRSRLPGSLLKGSYHDLASPFTDQARDEEMLWHPAMWYRPMWPKMKAFALPGFTKGRIRINLRGRDPHGIVEPGDYDALCTEIEGHLRRLRDARSGEPLVKAVYRTRRDSLADDPKLPEFDLDVLWHERITDVVDSPDFGRIGPFPHFRAGGHWNRGFVAAAGPGIAAGTSLPTAAAVDLPATILQFLGCPVPGHMDGVPLFPRKVPSGGLSPAETPSTGPVCQSA